MDFLLNVNGLNSTQQWKQMNHQQNKVDNKRFDDKEETSEEIIKDDVRGFKKYLIDLQDDVTMTQDKINLLEIAGQTLNQLSGSLKEMRQNALDTVDQLEGFTLDEKLKEKIENINKLEGLQDDFISIKDSTDQRYSNILSEFKNISNITLGLAQNEVFKSEVNANTRIEEVLNDINNTIETVQSATVGLDKVKDRLVDNIQNLNITLENMNSSFNRIRNIDLATKAVQIAQKHILNAAEKGIKMDLQVNETSVSRLIN
jgi:hypothetical protein